MQFAITVFTIESHDAVYALWKNCAGIGLSQADTIDSIQAYLNRNPGMSYIAKIDDDVVGAILAGHDGRRGYIHHLAVDHNHRKKGIARGLVEKSLSALRSQGIQKCHLFVFNDNSDGLRLWNSLGWKFRNDLGVISKVIKPSP